MGYPQEIMSGAIVRTSSNFDTAEVLTAAAAVYGSYMVHYPIQVSALTFHVSTAVSDLTASVVRLTSVSPADVTTAITNMTIPNGAAAAKVYRQNVTPTVVNVGHKLQFEHLTQGGLGGTPAGAGFYGFLASLEPEYHGNQTQYVVTP
jgi:hypothetical protein